MTNPGDAVPYGDDALIRQIQDLGRQLRESNAARSLEASQIGSGGIRVTDGGSITVEAPGTIDLTGGAFSAATITATGTVQGATVTSTANVNAAGSVNATTDVTASGRLIGTAGVRSPGARANVLTTWIAAQIDPSGNFGIVSSSVDVKQDFEPVDMSGEIAAIFSAALIEFRYIAHVAEYGDDAPVMLGSLAQYFESIGLGRYVTRNIDGEIDGIQYAELVKPLIATVQNLNQRLLALDSRVAALEAAQPTQTA